MGETEIGGAALEDGGQFRSYLFSKHIKWNSSDYSKVFTQSTHVVSCITENNKDKSSSADAIAGRVKKIMI